MNRLDAIAERPQFEEILQQALALPEEERARLVDHLLHSLNALTQNEIDQAWTEEIERRVREIEEGKVELIPGEEVMKKLRSRSQE
jgi:putative addiction module component (TIGR02574 family)